LNALLQENRVIVTDIPGTTRDIIEESISLGGLLFDLSDTAGIRDTKDPIEIEGVRRAEERLLNCDILAIVLDSTRDVGFDEAKAIDRITKAVECRGADYMFIMNKTDLVEPGTTNQFHEFTHLTEGHDALRVSAKTHQGLEVLKDLLVRKALHGAPSRSEGGVTITSARHFSALERAVKSLVLAVETVESGRSGELVTVDLRIALDALGEIIGATSTEDILDSIFSRFCIGK
jgi:tRNA modification GTPase